MDAGGTATTECPPNRGSEWKHESPDFSRGENQLLVNAYHVTYGLEVTVTRSTNNYGPNQYPEKLIPRLITNALRGKSLPIFGSGQNIRDWIFVDDKCGAQALDFSRGES